MIVLTSFHLRSNLGSTMGILFILFERGTSSAPMPERVTPRHSGFSRSPMERENNIFGFFGVWHENRGHTKYSINSCPFFIRHLECNKRCRIKSMISNFVAPKFSCGDYSWIETGLYLTGLIRCNCFWNIF